MMAATMMMMFMMMMMMISYQTNHLIDELTILIRYMHGAQYVPVLGQVEKSARHHQAGWQHW